MGVIVMSTNVKEIEYEKKLVLFIDILGFDFAGTVYYTTQ